jgi:trimeric autotransporter adhesin
VVNSTVTSSRPGAVAGLLPVQTFRTDATTGTVTDVTNHVGGEQPAEVDGPANTTSANLSTFDTATQEVQSLTIVKVGTSTVAGIDFGYNFDTIVNTNNTGQGSLRQFITNSNTLTNAGLAQVGKTAGKEVSIFMIPDGAAHPGLRAGMASGINGTGGNTNAAVISLTANFSITDANTQLDATTQTTNVGDLNPGTVGTGGTVGVDGLALSTIPKPEVVFDLRLVPANTNAMIVKGGNTVLKGFASYGYRTTGNLSTLLKAAIVVDAVVPDASRAIITQLLGGTMADGSDPAVPTIDVGYTLQTAGAVNISNNYFAYNSDAITFENTNGTSVNFIDNELAYNGPKNNNGSNGSGIYADQMETVQGTKNITLRGNLVRNSTKPGYANSQGQGIQISYSSFITLENNTFTDNNVYAINASSSDTLIRKNIIAGTKNTGLGQGSGIVVYYGGPLNTGLRNRITQNSIYQNAKLGIDHQVDGVTPNDGTIGAAQPNNGIDYPIVTSSLLNGNDLIVKGYVGNVATGSPTFANVTLEFFIADDDGNNNGKVFSTDPATVSKPHGEGKTYIGTCTANGSSLFDCTFANVNNLMSSGQTFDPKNITATATDAVGNTSEFSTVPIVNNPNVLLVKRITAINGGTSTFGGDSLAGYIDELTNAYDDNTITIPTQPNPSDPPKDTNNWPTLSSFMRGGINGGNIKPTDELDYTIYFLSTGDSDATNVLLCDRVPSNVTFVPTAFNGQATAPGGLGTGDRGILFNQGTTTGSLSNIGDGDIGQYLAPGISIGSVYPSLGNSCGTNDNGAIVVNLGTIPKADGPGSPPNSYGFVRFRGRVK